MGIRPDMKYNGKVGNGSMLIQTEKGSLGYQVMLQCEDGETSFTIWMTPRNKDRAIKSFEAMGVDPEKLKEPSYLEYKLAFDIQGKEVSFGTKTEVYNGKSSVKVGWIGKKSEGNMANAAASFFGGTVTPVTPSPDEEIPF
jgi:hypothetical protein